MERELTPQIRQWLDTPPDQRDAETGATLYLRVTRNRILYNNVLRQPGKYTPRLAYELEKIYAARLRDATHEEVRRMMARVDGINARLGLDRAPVAAASPAKSEFQRGRRADHDELPPEIQRLWVDNAGIMKRMRDCHTHLRLISPDNSSCPDSDRYPWAKEIIALDNQYRQNFDLYDHYVKGTPVDTAAVTPLSDKEKSAISLRLINMNKGKYAKNGDPALAERIRQWYADVADPSETLTGELTALGILTPKS